MMIVSVLFTTVAGKPPFIRRICLDPVVQIRLSFSEECHALHIGNVALKTLIALVFILKSYPFDRNDLEMPPIPSRRSSFL
jgi:hypothetical protein